MKNQDIAKVTEGICRCVQLPNGEGKVFAEVLEDLAFLSRCGGEYGDKLIAAVNKAEVGTPKFKGFIRALQFADSHFPSDEVKRALARAEERDLEKWSKTVPAVTSAIREATEKISELTS